MYTCFSNLCSDLRHAESSCPTQCAKYACFSPINIYGSSLGFSRGDIRQQSFSFNFCRFFSTTYKVFEIFADIYIEVINVYSIGKFAKYLGVTIETLRNWHKSGKLIPAEITEGGTRYYSDEQLSEYMKPMCQECPFRKAVE